MGRETIVKTDCICIEYWFYGIETIDEQCYTFIQYFTFIPRANSCMNGTDYYRLHVC